MKYHLIKQKKNVQIFYNEIFTLQQNYNYFNTKILQKIENQTNSKKFYGKNKKFR